MIATMITATPAKKPNFPPFFTFVGPDTHHQVSAINATGNQVASFTVSGNRSEFTISRNGTTSDTTPLCTSHKSSMSGARTMTVHNQAATMREEGARFEVMTASGPLKCRITTDGMGGKLWVDESKNTVAMGSKKEGQLKVFVNADEFVLDCLEPSIVEKGLTKGLLLGFKVIGAAMGGVGGAGGN